MGHFCPPGSGFRIRIHWSDWIRIRNPSAGNTRRMRDTWRIFSRRMWTASSRTLWCPRIAASLQNSSRKCRRLVFQLRLGEAMDQIFGKMTAENFCSPWKLWRLPSCRNIVDPPWIFPPWRVMKKWRLLRRGWSLSSMTFSSRWRASPWWRRWTATDHGSGFSDTIKNKESCEGAWAQRGTYETGAS